MIDNGLTPQKFLGLILSCCHGDRSINATLNQELKSLITLAAKKGANLKEINSAYPGLKLASGEQFFWRDQGLLINRLALALANSDHGLAGEIKKTKNGLCHGLTTACLHSKCLGNDLFTNTVTTLTTWDGKSDLAEKIPALKTFLQAALLFQFPEDYVLGASQCDIEKIVLEGVQKGLLDPKISKLKKKYTIASSFTVDKLTNLLQQAVHNDELVYVVHPGHSTGLFKHGDAYYFYDPNNTKGEYVTTCAKEAASAIFDVFKSDNKNRSIGLMIYGDKKFNNTYPAQKEFLAEVCSKDDLEEGVQVAVSIGCLESLKPLVDRWSNITNKQNFAGSFGSLMLREASLFNQSFIITELLKREADPNQITEEYYDKNLGEYIQGFTCFHVASKYGYVEAMKALLTSKIKISIDKKDSTGKTALDYAKDKDDERHREITRLLEGQK